MSADKANWKEIFAEYLALVRTGQAPDPQALRRQNPELVAELESFFSSSDLAQSAPTAAPDEVTLKPGQTFAVGKQDKTQLDPGSTVDGLFGKISRTIDSPVAGESGMFGDYELIEEVARGGMGVVYKARHVKLSRIVALKMILAGQLASDSEVQRFHAEADSAAALDHPGIVPIYDVGEVAGHHYFSMAFIDGSSLADRIKDGPLPNEEAVAYVKKVAEAMAYAHDCGVIHRDLKPANVLLDKNDEPKVTDFGLAKKVQDKSGLTATGEILGTPSYMPPEQAAGKSDNVGEATDVYLIGALLYALVTGRPPFQAASPVDTLLQVLERDPVPPRLLNTSVPADVETITLKCLEKEPHRRYASAQELVQELDRVLNNEPIQARPVSAFERAWRWSQRHRWFAMMVLLTAVLSFALLAGIIWAYLHERSMRTELSSAFAGERRQTERLLKLIEFVHNGERVRKFEETVEATAADRELIESLKVLYANPKLERVRAELNDPGRDPKAPSLTSTRHQFVAHPDRARVQAWLDAQGEAYLASDRPDVFAWFVQDTSGLQIARAPLGEDNVGHNFAWRSYFHGGQDDYEDLQHYVAEHSSAEEHLNKTSISAAFVTELTDEWVVAISTPVYSDAARTDFLGVVGVFLYITPPD